MRTTILCLTVLALLSFSAAADACSCARPKADPIEAITEAYESSDVVFLGRVINVIRPEGREQGSGQMIEESTFRVLRMWKGGEAEELTSRIDIQCCVCGVSFTEGREHLIFGYLRPDGSFSTSICSGPGIPTPQAIVLRDELFPPDS